MNKLPVIATVKDSIGYTLSNISLLMRASLVWVVIYTFLVAIFSFLGGDEFMQIYREFVWVSESNISEGSTSALEVLFRDLNTVGDYTGVFFIFLRLFGLLAYYGFAISWHRACLLDEHPPLIRLGKLEFKYLLLSFLLALMLYILFLILGLIGSLVIGAVFGAIGGAQLAVLSVYATFTLVAIGLLLAYGRANLVFPGVAVRDKRMNLGTSFKVTQGNSWEIFAGNFLCFLPAILVAIIYIIIDNLGLPIIITMPIMMVLNFISVAFALSFLSMCYQFFVPSPDVGDLA